jgi:hypothetical protein
MKCVEEEKKDEETHSMNNKGGGEGWPHSLILLCCLVRKARHEKETMLTVEDRDRDVSSRQCTR